MYLAWMVTFHCGIMGFCCLNSYQVLHSHPADVGTHRNLNHAKESLDRLPKAMLPWQPRTGQKGLVSVLATRAHIKLDFLSCFGFLASRPPRAQYPRFVVVERVAAVAAPVEVERVLAHYGPRKGANAGRLPIFGGFRMLVRCGCS